MSPRRARENEQFMEELNERMEATLREIRDETDDDPDAPFRFFCECADIACRDRIEVRPSRLDAIHSDSERFVVKPGHEIPSVERIVDQEEGYLIVRKTA
jgi:hypothetical protein